MAERLECVCGCVFESGRDYEVVEEGGKYLIECKGPRCPLRVLGEVEREALERGEVDPLKAFKKAFVTWNAARLGLDRVRQILSRHLSEIAESLG